MYVCKFSTEVEYGTRGQLVPIRLSPFRDHKCILPHVHSGVFDPLKKETSSKVKLQSSEYQKCSFRVRHFESEASEFEVFESEAWVRKYQKWSFIFSQFNYVRKWSFTVRWCSKVKLHFFLVPLYSKVKLHSSIMFESEASQFDDVRKWSFISF